MLNRRRFLVGTAGFSVLGLSGAFAANSSLRGALNATELGLRANSSQDQSKAFAKMLREAADRNAPIFLPPGNYILSSIALPAAVRLSGVAGATRIVFGGNGHLFSTNEAQHIDLQGLTFDGANHAIDGSARALIDLKRVARLIVEGCEILGSGRDGLALERASGRVNANRISGAADFGIFSVDASGLDIIGNNVSDCGNGGILVHRWAIGEDGTNVTGNRVSRIASRNGGTGQTGNGINAFRAGNVIVANNMVSDCAFSAIRANSSGNIQIRGNTCQRLGETALYAEFAFEGAVITDNIVDGAANGVSIANFNEGGRMAVCSGNLVRNLTTKGPYEATAAGFGIGLSVEADTTVTGNIVEGARLGMNIGWGPFMRNVTATGNVLRKVSTGIAVSVVEGVGAATIANNIIEDASNGGIVGYRWADPVTVDLAREPDARMPNLIVSNNQLR
ncbi:TIGR03808 family TAT-translocated repetitive protein [Mesorhizobium sp. SB112]|uniref:TIGR03808 family TAT-translocated repetitive protein n=1 Tax=Mesorhizobium sp. SB112 TaxID=3151853 RepID=UPI0032640E9C